jgi:HSP20 family protein
MFNDFCYKTKSPTYTTVTLAPLKKNSMFATDWTPLMDIEKIDNTIFYRLEVPGVTKEDLEVTLEGNVLTVSGVKKIKRSESEYRSYERYDGKFLRSVSLPKNIQENSIKVELDMGVLTVSVALAEEEQKKKLTIN